MQPVAARPPASAGGFSLSGETLGGIFLLLLPYSIDFMFLGVLTYRSLLNFMWRFRFFVRAAFTLLYSVQVRIITWSLLQEPAMPDLRQAILALTAISLYFGLTSS